jgi:hypothetical protein
LALKCDIARASWQLAIVLALCACSPAGARAASDPEQVGPGEPAAPGPAATVRVTPRGPILSEGSDPGRLEILEVVVVDAAGNPAADVPAGSGGRGEFREALLVEPGIWALPYHPPPVLADSTERVVVRAGPVSTQVELQLVIQRPTFPLGMKAGVAAAGGRLGPAVGLEGAAWTVLGRAQVGLLLDASWWMLSSTASASIGGADASVRSTQNYFPVLISLGWRVPVADAWMLWVTAGGGGAVVSSSVQVSGQPSVSESGFAPAATGSLSAGPRFGPGFPFLEARATWIGDPGLSTVSGSVTTFLAFLGYRLHVF